MKKYRVVKAYTFYKSGKHYDRLVGELLGPDVVRENQCDDVAFQTGALEEIKPWEPKVDEESFLVTTVLDGVLQVISTTGSLTEKSRAILREGLLYPTKEQAEECRKRMLEVAKKYKEEVLG